MVDRSLGAIQTRSLREIQTRSVVGEYGPHGLLRLTHPTVLAHTRTVSRTDTFADLGDRLSGSALPKLGNGSIDYWH